MTLRDRVLASLCGEGDRAACLVYADQLEEAGDPRREFWRLVGKGHLWPEEETRYGYVYEFLGGPVKRRDTVKTGWWHWVFDGLAMSPLRPHALSSVLFAGLGKPTFWRGGCAVKRYGGPTALRRALLAAELAWDWKGE